MKQILVALFCIVFFASMIYIAKKDMQTKSTTNSIESLRLNHSDDVCREPEINNELP